MDDFEKAFSVAEMKKIFGPALIRFQTHSTWMGLKRVRLVEIISQKDKEIY